MAVAKKGVKKAAKSFAKKASATGAATEIDLRGLNRALLARQLLLARADVPVAEAVARLGGVQAQWPKPPHFALAARLDTFAPADLNRAAMARAVVRGTLHRGTLHLVSAAAYIAQRQAMQPMLDKALASILKSRPPFDLERVTATARALLAEGPSTFTALRERLLRAHPDVDERAMGYAVRMRLALLMVPTDDAYGWPADACFALAENEVGPLAAAGEGVRDGRRAFVRDYLAAFGPATVQDAQTGSGLTALAPEFAALEASGELVRLQGPARAELFDLASAPRPPADTPAPPRLLPEFDASLLAHRDRTRIVAVEHRAKVSLPGLRIPATFLLDGFVAGTWTVEGRGAKARIALAPFAAITKRDRSALEDEGERLLRAVVRT